MMLRIFGTMDFEEPRIRRFMLTTDINRQVLEIFEDLSEKDFKGNLIIIEPRKVRIRKK